MTINYTGKALLLPQLIRERQVRLIKLSHLYHLSISSVQAERIELRLTFFSSGACTLDILRFEGESGLYRVGKRVSDEINSPVVMHYSES